MPFLLVASMKGSDIYELFEVSIANSGKLSSSFAVSAPSVGSWIVR